MTPPTAAATELPTRLGPYLLGPVVGVGASAVVVRARDTRTDADVAIKLLRVADPAVGAKFLRECRLLRQVTHSSLLGLHDLGETPQSGPYLVMDLARDSLADRLRSADPPADAPTLGAVVSALTEGLGALHRNGIVHRNVKPENLLLVAESWTSTTWRPGTVVDEDERIVLGDLGIAERAAEKPGAANDYRAPEQRIPGQRVDPSADVYAATAVLWALVVGRTPPTPDALAVEVQSAPAEWRDFFRTGMAADPAARYADMPAWAEAAVAAIRVAAAQAAPRRQTAIAVPYKGLAAYQPEDAPLFFGRAALADALVACMARHP
ncbi:MAG: serine/threonine-protein kinase, partial [Sporichthyaceae bacterium]